jgi:hypothetical protein
MGLTNAAKERIAWRRAQKEGKTCATCGSAFELTLQHREDQHLNNRQKMLDPVARAKVVVLCATCHFIEDSEKMLLCYPRASLRKYQQQCDEEWARYERLVRKGVMG